MPAIGDRWAQLHVGAFECLADRACLDAKLPTNFRERVAIFVELLGSDDKVRRHFLLWASGNTLPFEMSQQTGRAGGK